jgi:hypothetical protein
VAGSYVPVTCWLCVPSFMRPCGRTPLCRGVGSQPKAVDLDYNLKLIGVAPGKSRYDAVGRLTGDSSLAKANIPRDGFSVALVRLASGCPGRA